MDAIKIYENAEGKLERGKITLGEFERLIDPLSNVIPIPKGATNGEVLNVLFEERIYNALKDRMQYTKWWNAPYKGVEE